MTSATQAIVWSIEQQPFGETVPPSLTSVGYNASKQFQMTVNGGPNYNYIVQASTSLSPAIWVSVATNGAPFTFTDSGTQNSNSRFYRVIAVASSTNTVGVTMNLRFPGQYFEAESALNNNMMRDYDSTIGRYIQSDPIGLSGGINVYEYVGASPIMHRDPNGLDPLGSISFGPVFKTLWSSYNTMRAAGAPIGAAVDVAVTEAATWGVLAAYTATAQSLVVPGGIWAGENIVYPGFKSWANNDYPGGYDGFLEDSSDVVSQYGQNYNSFIDNTAASGLDAWDAFGNTLSVYEGAGSDVLSQYEQYLGINPQPATSSNSGDSCP
jgi:RHS repeat-associated protein